MLKTLFRQSSRSITEPQSDCVWRDLNYQLKVSKKRRSIGFRVHGQGVSVTVPYGLDEQLLEQALGAKYAWLQDKLEQLQQQSESAASVPSQLVDGERWPVFGEWLPVRIEQAKVHSITVTEGGVKLVFTSRQQSVASQWRLWQQWYRQQALAYAEDRVDYWITQMASQLPLLPASVSVRQYRSRWGSCTSHGELKFNYLLAMAPKTVFDYVVVHELCHLKHMHHGKEFWHMVAEYCPQWQQQRQWLKQYGGGLLMELST
jgi:predicted metal-dependent hydrolase